jgi:DNA-binding TFAR19-related protein (PDSD5 family)
MADGSDIESIRAKRLQELQQQYNKNNKSDEVLLIFVLITN